MTVILSLFPCYSLLVERSTCQKGHYERKVRNIHFPSTWPLMHGFPSVWLIYHLTRYHHFYVTKTNYHRRTVRWLYTRGTLRTYQHRLGMHVDWSLLKMIAGWSYELRCFSSVIIMWIWLHFIACLEGWMGLWEVT